MNAQTSKNEKNSPFAHMFYFEMADNSSELLNDFTKLCKKYLSGYSGQTHFSIGYRALDINRRVSATNFEVAVHMIFESFEHYEHYAHAPKHEEFITKVAGMSTDRIVYDSFLVTVVDSPIKKKSED